MSDLECPWCKSKISESVYEEMYSDGETYETECPECENGIEIHCSVSINHSIEAIGCDRHVLKEYISTRIFKCTFCSKTIYDFELPGGQYPKLKEGDFDFYKEDENENKPE